MNLIDIIKQPTKVIEAPAEVVQAVKETASKESKPAKPGDANTAPASAEKIELAAEINAAALTTLIEAPLSFYNNVFNYKVARKKARKRIKPGKELDDLLKRIDDNYKENKDMINFDDAEYGRLKDIMRARAKMNGGKVNEGLELASILLGSVIKRAVVFVPVD